VCPRRCETGLSVVGLERDGDAPLRDRAFGIGERVGGAGAARDASSHHTIREAEEEGPLTEPTGQRCQPWAQRGHQMRHSFGSLLLQNGVPITYVAEQLGHKDPSITLRVHSH
jgi:hypothetical protein